MNRVYKKENVLPWNYVEEYISVEKFNSYY